MRSGAGGSRARRGAWRAAGLVASACTAPLGLLAQTPAPAGADTTTRVTFGGFVDGYYAYDFGRPADLDRRYTTQAARHNEFNVNLAFVEGVATGPRVRGRLAIQAGTSVQSNYAAEPTVGTVSGPDLSRFLQEAYAGYRVAPTVWVDGGVFFSHMGMETWVSSQNPTYTRSLVSDYSPYYSAGVRAVWQASPRLTAHLHVVNGWQNVSESNADKAAGIRLDWTPTSWATLSYYNYAGNEPDARLRLFNGVGATASLGPRVRVLAELDVGRQERGADSEGWSTWYGLTLVGRYQLASAVAVVARVERLDDRDEVVIATDDGVPGFRANGASVGVDVTPAPRLLWRTELRGLRATDAIFVDRSGAAGRARRNAVVVTALGLGF